MDRGFVLGILRGEYERVVAPVPALPPEYHRSLAVRSVGHHRPWRRPECQARDDGFRFALTCLGARCGASTRSTLYLPVEFCDAERNAVIAHEHLHGVAKRLGLTEFNESDFWWTTAARVQWAQHHPKGRALYPGWFVEAIPAEVVALF